MPRRVRVPSPDELFRPTGEGAVPELTVVEPPARPARAASGRVRHEEKMTLYVTSEELLDLEDARLALRRTHEIAVDRGRLVRAAVALALADLDANGADSALVRRLHEG